MLFRFDFYALSFDEAHTHIHIHTCRHICRYTRPTSYTRVNFDSFHSLFLWFYFFVFRFFVVFFILHAVTKQQENLNRMAIKEKRSKCVLFLAVNFHLACLDAWSPSIIINCISKWQYYFHFPFFTYILFEITVHLHTNTLIPKWSEIYIYIFDFHLIKCGHYIFFNIKNVIFFLFIYFLLFTSAV